MRILTTIILSAVMSQQAFARTVEILSQGKFDALNPAQLSTDKVYYTQKVLSFEDWGKLFPEERAKLVLFPEYVEPTATYMKNSLRKTRIEKLMVFSTRSRVVLNSPAAKISIKNLLSLDAMAKFDSEFKHKKIQQNQLMTSVVGKGQINNFLWCNKDPKDPHIARPQRELDLKSAIPKTRNWCSDPANSLCVESCYIFDTGMTAGVMAINLKYDDDAEKKDYGISLQSEVRAYTDEKELGLKGTLATLTGINSPVASVLEQNMFYFNQIFEFGKVLVVLQEMPGSPDKTIATAFFVVGIKKRTYDMFDEVGKFLRGESMFNSSKGITAGLPKFIQATIVSISSTLEAK